MRWKWKSRMRKNGRWKNKRKKSNGAVRFVPMFCTRTAWPRTLRTNVEMGNVDAVLDGDLGAFIEAFLMQSKVQGTQD